MYCTYLCAGQQNPIVYANVGGGYCSIAHQKGTLLPGVDTTGFGLPLFWKNTI